VLNELFERALCWRWSERRVGWQVRTLRGHSEEVNSVAFSRDGKWIVSGSSDADVKIWDVATGAEVRYFEGVRFAQTPQFGVERYCFFGERLMALSFRVDQGARDRRTQINLLH